MHGGKNTNRDFSITRMTTNFCLTLASHVVCVLNTFTLAIIGAFLLRGHSMGGKNTENPHAHVPFLIKGIKGYLSSL